MLMSMYLVTLPRWNSIWPCTWQIVTVTYGRTPYSVSGKILWLTQYVGSYASACVYIVVAGEVRQLAYG